MKEPTLKQLKKSDLLWELDRATEKNNQRRVYAVMKELKRRHEKELIEIK